MTLLKSFTFCQIYQFVKNCLVLIKFNINSKYIWVDLFVVKHPEVMHTSYLPIIPEEEMGLAANSVLVLWNPDKDKFNHPLTTISTLNTALSIMWLHISSVIGWDCQFYCWRQLMSYTWIGMLPFRAPCKLLHSRTDIGNTNSTSRYCSVDDKIISKNHWVVGTMLLIFFEIKLAERRYVLLRSK